MLGKDILKDETILRHLQRTAGNLEDAYNDLNKMKETESAQNSEEVINNIDKLLNQIKDFSQFVYEWSAGKIDMSV